MSVLIRAGEQPAGGPAGQPSGDLRVTVTAAVTAAVPAGPSRFVGARTVPPGGGPHSQADHPRDFPVRPQIRRATDVVRLRRTRARVTGSQRLPATAEPAAVSDVQRMVDDLVLAVFPAASRFPAVPAPMGAPPGAESALHWQSAVVTVNRRARVLGRWESPAGPLLLGGDGPAAAAAVLAWCGEWQRLLAGRRPLLSGPASGWDGVPVVLGPAVAAAVVVGVRWVLGTSAAGRLDGRRVLPAVTLVDHPVEHAPGERDDAGLPVAPWVLARAGTVATMPVDPATGVPVGRAVWQHDEGRLTMAGSFALEVDGPAGDARPAPPPESLELLQCVEGVRRYLPDGRMRLVCLARLGAAARPFLVGLSGRPLSLLRAVTGLAGESSSIATDHLVSTPSLVLPTAQSLERRADVRFSPV
jgi:hypothetical protein